MTPQDETTGDTVAVILARMEVKLDHALGIGTDHEARIRALEGAPEPKPIPDHSTEVSDHESRIRVLEKKVWTAAGFSAALTAPVTFFVSHLGK